MTKPKEQSQTRSISQPVSWWEIFEKAAAREGLPLSSWLGEAAKDRAGRKRMPPRARVGRPLKASKENKT